MHDLATAAPAIGMIAAFVLLLGGVRLVRRGASRTQGILMIVAALVIATNVMIWTV